MIDGTVWELKDGVTRLLWPAGSPEAQAWFADNGDAAETFLAPAIELLAFQHRGNWTMTDPVDEFDDLPDDAPLPGTAEPDQPDPGNAPIREDDQPMTTPKETT